MSDARISTALPSHPKTKKLMRRLGAAGPWALICLFLWARDSRADGNLSGMTDEDIELAANWSGDDGALVAALVSVGFMDGSDGERRIHDWEEHQPWSAGASRRSEVARSNASKKWGVDLVAENRIKRSERLANGRKLGTHTGDEWAALLIALGGACLACGTPADLCKDHVHPLYLGGSDGIDNIQPLCRACNSRKCGPGNETDYRPSDWAERLRNELIRNGTPAERLPNACKTPSELEKNACSASASVSVSVSDSVTTSKDDSLPGIGIDPAGPKPGEKGDDDLPQDLLGVIPPGRVKPATIACPGQEIANLWDRILCPEAAAIALWNPRRARVLGARWKEQAESEGWQSKDEGLKWFEDLFTGCRRSRFLMGKVPPKNGNLQFKLKFDWFFGPENFTRVVEGDFHRGN